MTTTRKIGKHNCQTPATKTSSKSNQTIHKAQWPRQRQKHIAVPAPSRQVHSPCMRYSPGIDKQQSITLSPEIQSDTGMNEEISSPEMKKSWKLREVDYFEAARGVGSEI